MAGTVLKQFEITAEQDERLRQYARECGLSESELIQRAIEQSLRTSPRSVRDLSDWEAQVAFARTRVSTAIVDAGSGRGWTRQDLHERSY